MRQSLLGQYLRGFPQNEQDKSSQLVFYHLWSRDPEKLIALLSDFYMEDETRLGRVVDIAKDLGVGPSIKYSQIAILTPSDSRQIARARHDSPRL